MMMASNFCIFLTSTPATTNEAGFSAVSYGTTFSGQHGTPRRLQRLHPDFYPIAATQTDKGPMLYKDGFLTKEGLMKLYWKCGDVLHRGSFKALPSSRYLDADIEEIATWKRKISRWKATAT
jgi:hypothetical protein